MNRPYPLSLQGRFRLYKIAIAPGIFLLLLHFFLYSSCKNENSQIKAVYTYKKPYYDSYGLQTTPDSLHFLLTENTYNSIKSFNYFAEGSKEYISFFDERSGSINVYDFKQQALKKTLLLKNILPGKKLHKTTVYCKRFDSIFVTNRSAFYLIDSAGKILKSIKFLEKPEASMAAFENTTPPVFAEHAIYAGVRPYVKENSFSALRSWKTLYKFDLATNKASLHYPLPELYQQNLFGYHFLDYSYCYNDRGNFVFSFPADSNIYETNLFDHRLAYFAKSQHQKETIKPLSKADLANPDQSFKNYLLRYSYGAIYFDAHNKRYLRVAKSKISLQDYNADNKKRDYYLIIFNNELQIIGESKIDEGISYSSIFFAIDGEMYARTKAKDEYAIHFVRLSYTDKSDKHLTHTNR